MLASESDEFEEKADAIKLGRWQEDVLKLRHEKAIEAYCASREHFKCLPKNNFNRLLNSHCKINGVNLSLF